MAKKSNFKPLAVLTLLSLFIGGAVSGYLQSLPMSTTDSRVEMVFPLDGNSYKFIGMTISSDKQRLQFYINGKPIFAGQIVDGIWLGHQKTESGLFIFPSASKYSIVMMESDVTPPNEVFTSPFKPQAGELTYFHARGVWDSDSQYSTLEYRLLGTINDYGVATYRIRSGIYDTSSPASLLYNEFKTNVQSGTYTVSFAEAYMYYDYMGGSDILGLSQKREYDFTVVPTTVEDKNPPTINNPSVALVGDIVVIKADITDSENNLKRAYVRFGSVEYDIIGGEATTSYAWLNCDSNYFVFNAMDSAGNTAIPKTVVFNKNCQPVTPQPTKTPPPTKTITPVNKDKKKCEVKNGLTKCMDEDALFLFVLGFSSTFAFGYAGARRRGYIY